MLELKAISIFPLALAWQLWQYRYFLLPLPSAKSLPAFIAAPMVQDCEDCKDCNDCQECV